VKVLIDTHVLLWWRAGGDRLTTEARTRLEGAQSVFVSPITFWEVATLLRQGRIALDRPLADWVVDLLAEPQVEVAHLSPGAAATAGVLPATFPGDPADRLIYATAVELGTPLLSKDERVRSFAESARSVAVIW